MPSVSDAETGIASEIGVARIGLGPSPILAGPRVRWRRVGSNCWILAASCGGGRNESFSLHRISVVRSASLYRNGAALVRRMSSSAPARALLPATPVVSAVGRLTVVRSTEGTCDLRIVASSSVVVSSKAAENANKQDGAKSSGEYFQRTSQEIGFEQY